MDWDSQTEQALFVLDCVGFSSKEKQGAELEKVPLVSKQTSCAVDSIEDKAPGSPGT